VSGQDLRFQSAIESARLIRAKKLSPVELVEASLRRIEEVNPALNCFCFVYPEEALAAARTAEAAAMAGEALGPLHGVPIAIKDLTPTKGKVTTQGSYIHEHWVPDHDAVVVERLLAAGAILVGKTTTPEFAFSCFTDSPLWGATRNPWNPERTPGGSSGGSGAAVASGCVPLAEGSDMGGSVRIPASFCGISGLKPSFGRIPFDIFPSQFDSYCHFGPLARSADDLALFLQVAQGPDDRDISSLPRLGDVPIPLPADVRGMKLALSVDLGCFAVDPEVERRTRETAERFRDLGASVEEVRLDWTAGMIKAGNAHWNVYMAALFAQHLPQWRDRMTADLVRYIEDGLDVDAMAFKRLEFVRTELWNRLRPILHGHDALLCPTMSIPAPPVGTSDYDFGYDRADGKYVQVEMTFPFNMLSACPAASVPAGFSAGGLPIGLQIVGRRHDDLTVLRLAAALERSRPPAQPRPPI